MTPKRKISVRKVAAMCVEMVIDGMKDLPKAEQERRIQVFCEDAEARIAQRTERRRPEAKGPGWNPGVGAMPP